MLKIKLTNMRKLLIIAFACLLPAIMVCGILFTGCKGQTKIKMYDVTTSKVETLKLEDYVAGATAAEMDDSFALSALETQAILCRTYAIYFKQNKLSKYKGADISNDITEAQAYTNKVSNKIKQAVKNTSGKIITDQSGKTILPYYCNNCGGKNSLASTVLGAKTDYIKQVETGENEQNSKDFSWQASLTKADILYAVRSLGGNLASVNSFKVNKTDSAGRALEFNIGGIVVNANKFRLAVGSTIFKSCLITNIAVSNTSVTFSGLGYGHGVGLSQHGANILAQSNYTWDKIIGYYFSDVKIVTVK